MDPATADSLAAAYRQGRADALPPLVNGLARQLLAQAFRFVHDWDLAADMVQDTWLLATDAVHRYDPSRPFIPWLLAILRNRCLQHLQSTTRQPQPVSLVEVGNLATKRPDDQPDRSVLLADLRQRVAFHLQALPATQRQALVLIDLEHQSQAQTATELNLTPASLRVILHRGRKALAQRLQKEEKP